MAVDLTALRLLIDDIRAKLAQGAELKDQTVERLRVHVIDSITFLQTVHANELVDILVSVVEAMPPATLLGVIADILPLLEDETRNGAAH